MGTDLMSSAASTGRRMGSLKTSTILSQPLLVLASILLVPRPASALEHLLCNVCPLHEKSELCPNFTTECQPGERCTSSRGFYGALHVLSAQGCVSTALCGSHEMVTFRGTKYKVHHACCSQNTCNEAPESKTTLKELLQMIKTKANDTEVAVEKPLDVSANTNRNDCFSCHKSIDECRSLKGGLFTYRKSSESSKRD